MKIHKTAEVAGKAIIGKGTSVWNQAQIRENAKIGKNCIISKNVYIDFNVKIGNNVKIQNNVSVYHGVIVEDGVFIGPHVCFTNDKNPRAINPDGTLKSNDEWEVSKILVKEGASIGAGSVIVSGVTIGKFAMIGAGSVVTKDIPNYSLAYGVPVRIKGYICKCGKKIEKNVKCNKCEVIIK